MIEPTSRIMNTTSAKLLLFQIVFGYIYYIKPIMSKSILNNTLLKERPGLQNITYTAIIDFFGEQRLVPSMCEKALL